MITSEKVHQIINSSEDTTEADFSNQSIQMINNLAPLSQRRLNIQKLYFNNNQLTILNNLVPILSLQLLDLSNNNLQQITCMLPFPKLKVFSAKNNKIHTITSQFPTAIEIIDLQNNCITNKNSIKSVVSSNAQIIELQGNPITNQENITQPIYNQNQSNSQNAQNKPQTVQNLIQMTQDQLLTTQNQPKMTQIPRQTNQSQLAPSNLPNHPNSTSNFSQKAYDELIKIYETQLLQKQKIGFPNPSNPPNFALLKRRLFQALYDLENEQKSAQKLKTSQVKQQEEIDILRAKLTLKDQEIADLKNQIDENNEEITNYHNNQYNSTYNNQLLVNSLSEVKLELNIFSKDQIEFQTEIDESIEVLDVKLQKLTKKIKIISGEIKPKIASISTSSQTENEIKQFSKQTETEELIMQNDAVQAEISLSTRATSPILQAKNQVNFSKNEVVFGERTPELRKTAVPPPSLQLTLEQLHSDKLAVSAGKNAANLVVAKENHFESKNQLIQSKIKESDLNMIDSVLEIAKKYQHIQLDQQCGQQKLVNSINETGEINQSERVPVIKFFGVRPSSWIQQQLDEIV